MTEAAIFAVGAIMFILTAGATVTFGLFRVHELQIRDIGQSDRITEVEERGLTEIYRTSPVADDVPTASPVR